MSKVKASMALLLTALLVVSVLAMDCRKGRKKVDKGRERMEKMVAMMLLAYSIALLIGEEIRDRVYKGKRWKLYSGVFVLIKQRVQLARETITDIINDAYSFFSIMVQGDVRIHV
ncbi:hypothetical protein M1O19_03705 [Dehalococcoidia bacterium]|nr:hypothetical protein [Dehalococcoidia bacterium]